MGRFDIIKADIGFFLDIAKNNVEQQMTIYINELHKVCNPRSSYAIEKQIIQRRELWAKYILEIYEKLQYMKIKRESEVDCIEKMIRRIVEEDIEFKRNPDEIKSGERRYLALHLEYRKKVLGAIKEGNYLLWDKIKKERRERFRIYFPLFLGIVGALAGAIIGALATLYASGIWPY